MALVPMRKLLAHAQANKYAVGYFEAWNMDAMLAVADAAERTKSPVILGCGGMFLENGRRLTMENVLHYGAMGVSIAREMKVPAALLLNEADNLPLLYRALKGGFNAVMYASEMYSGEGYTLQNMIDMNRQLVPVAHAVGADVEAEIGELPMADMATGCMTAGQPTDPEEAAYFIRETGIDALAIAAGNVHLLEGKKSGLDLDLIERLTRRISVPLVLHGGTGIAPDALREAIRLGVAKLNVGTVMKRAYINAVREYLGSHDVDRMDPHQVIGYGAEQDMLTHARLAVTDAVAKFMDILGCCGRAAEW